MSALQEEDRLLIQDAVDKFIESSYPFEEKEKRLEEDGKFGANWPMFADLGWLMMPFSEEVGGLGGSVVDAHVLLRAFGRGLIAEPYTEVVLLAGKALELTGSEYALESLLIPLVSGELKLALAHGELKADAGFEHVYCQLKDSGSGLVLNGTKRVVWQASAADKYLITTLYNGEPALVCVDANSPGISTSESLTLDSRYAADVVLNNVEVTSEQLVAVGDTAANAVRQAVLFTMAALVGEARGIADSLVNMTAEYLNTREQFGARIVTFQALQHLFADMVIAKEEIHSLEWLMANAVEMDDPELREKSIRIAKSRLGKVAREIAETAVQLHGGVGVTDELVISHYLRRMVTIDSFYGDSQQQLLWLAQRY